ncbi:hypothetical protein VmeM32_00108 [Vibrio phage vB_VmeM-32]|nr:hypothetical protein VmeM32_00108 [Vibrio phage vB_VmeM-32]
MKSDNYLNEFLFIDDQNMVEFARKQKHSIMLNPNMKSIKCVTPNRQLGLTTMTALNVCMKIKTRKRRVTIYSESFETYKQIFKLNLWDQIDTMTKNTITLYNGSRIDFYRTRSKLDNGLRGIRHDLLVIDSFYNHDLDHTNVHFNEIIHVATGVDV